MKKSSFFLFGMLAALLAFGIVLAGCEGPVGPAGPAGTNGPIGPNGTDGYPGVVSLAAGSQGAKGIEEITGLEPTAKYIVYDGSKWYASKAGGVLVAADGKTTLEDALDDGPVALGGSITAITGLYNNKTYDVYLVKEVAQAASITVASISGHTIVQTTGTLAVNDAYSFTATSASDTVIFVLNGNITTDTNLASTTAITAADIITTDATVNTYTFGVTTAGTVKVEYTLGKKYFTFRDFGSSEVFTITASTETY